MNQTEHYKLSQWELSDRIQMKDFNGDNAKLEAALSRKLEVVTLVDETRTFDGTELDWFIPFEEGFFSSCIMLLVQFIHDRPGGYKVSLYKSDTNGMASFHSNGGTMVLFPARNPDAEVAFIPTDGYAPTIENRHLKVSQAEGLRFFYGGSTTMTGTIHCRVIALH